MDSVYTIPSHIRKYIEDIGYPFAYEPMSGYISQWHDVLTTNGDFWDYEETSGGIHRKVHRMTVHPAQKVCNEWASLIFDDDTVISCDDTACNEWLNDTLDRIHFKSRSQGIIAKGFALGTWAWVVWVDTDAKKLQVRRYDARMILPLSWDDDGITECAFATRVSVKGEQLDQLQLHMLDGDTYTIRTRYWTLDGNEREVEGVVPDFDTGSAEPWFAVCSPMIENTRVDLSPYGQSIFADAIDPLQSVDLCYDAMMNEVDLAKLRIFVSDMLVEYTTVDEFGNRVQHKNALPFGKDNTIFRKMASNDDMITPFAPAMRTEEQLKAYRNALQTMGDSCGFGLTYFDIDTSGGIRTATQVSTDNSQLMRNIKKHENRIEESVVQICRAILQCGRAFLDAPSADEGQITVMFDDSIITDTAAEKTQDMAEISAGIMNEWEYRVKWYGEDEETAKANLPDAQEDDGSIFDTESDFGEPIGEPDAD